MIELNEDGLRIEKLYSRKITFTTLCPLHDVALTWK